MANQNSTPNPSPVKLTASQLAFLREFAQTGKELYAADAATIGKRHFSSWFSEINTLIAAGYIIVGEPGRFHLSDAALKAVSE